VNRQCNWIHALWPRYTAYNFKWYPLIVSTSLLVVCVKKNYLLYRAFIYSRTFLCRADNIVVTQRLDRYVLSSPAPTHARNCLSKAVLCKRRISIAASYLVRPSNVLLFLLPCITWISFCLFHLCWYQCHWLVHCCAQGNFSQYLTNIKILFLIKGDLLTLCYWSY
jgi:hypothetical protein